MLNVLCKTVDCIHRIKFCCSCMCSCTLNWWVENDEHESCSLCLCLLLYCSCYPLQSSPICPSPFDVHSLTGLSSTFHIHIHLAAQLLPYIWMKYLVFVSVVLQPLMLIHVKGNKKKNKCSKANGVCYSHTI